ncbi:hypothetical protein LXL04_032075 [Taraxacum kok-saghyz]
MELRKPRSLLESLGRFSVSQSKNRSSGFSPLRNRLNRSSGFSLASIGIFLIAVLVFSIVSPSQNRLNRSFLTRTESQFRFQLTSDFATAFPYLFQFQLTSNCIFQTAIMDATDLQTDAAEIVAPSETQDNVEDIDENERCILVRTLRGWLCDKSAIPLNEHFYKATNRFSGTSYPTSNMFFGDICNIKLQIMKWESSEYEFLRKMANPMKLKFEKYWNECCLVLAVAVVFDPMYKMSLVEYYYNKIHGSLVVTYVEHVRNALLELFNVTPVKFPFVNVKQIVIVNV